VSAAGPGQRGPGENKHGRRRLRRRSSSRAPHKATGPLLRPPGCWRIALARDSPAGCPGPRRPRRPLVAGRAVRPRPAPASARRAGPAVAGVCGNRDAGEQDELAFDTQKRKEKLHKSGSGLPGPVTSSQQSHLAKLRHTEPGVHETRDAPGYLVHRSDRERKARFAT